MGHGGKSVPQQMSLDGFAEPPARRSSLFFALRPDAAAAARAEALAQQLAPQAGVSARADRTARFHVTLFHVGHFVGDIPAVTLAMARQTAQALQAAPFEVRFDRVATFSGKPGNLPLVLRGAEPCEGLMRFQARLDDALLRAGLCHGERHAQFTPHLTLLYARHAVPEQAIEPIAWQADRLVLYRSLIGEGRYIEEGLWPLEPSRP